MIKPIETAHTLAASLSAEERAILKAARQPIAQPVAPKQTPSLPRIPPARRKPSIDCPLEFARQEAKLVGLWLALRQQVGEVQRIHSSIDRVRVEIANQVGLCREQTRDLMVFFAPSSAADHDVLDFVCREFGTTVEYVKTRRRKRNLVDARNRIIRRLFTNYNWDKSRIARALGFDHSTVIHSLKATEAK